MKYKHIDLPLKRVRLWPLGDWHWGSRQCLSRFVREIVAEIQKDPESRWVGMGDLMENALLESKGDVYMQEKTPEEQIDEIVELLEPIADKCLYMIPGNHEERTKRQVGIHPSKIIADMLSTPEHKIPFCSHSVLLTLNLTKVRVSGCKSFLCYFHHNRGGGSTFGGKINRATKLRQIVPTADATFSAHMHITSRIPHTWYTAGRQHLQRRTGYDYIIGSSLFWTESYAEEKALPPSSVEQAVVTFVGGKRPSKMGDDTRKQLYTVITPS